MFLNPLWDIVCFLTLSIILMEVFVWPRVDTNPLLTYTKRLIVYKDNIPITIISAVKL